MANVKLNLVVAACNNRGIGVKGQLPWRLKKDMAFFKKITTETKDPDKRNAVIMGRITYFSIPEKFRPLAKRRNIILSRELQEAPPNTSLVRSLDEAVKLVTGSGELAENTESVFIIGGGLVYKEAMESNYDCRIYLTRVLADIDCDTFFPGLDENLYRKIDDCDDVPSGQFTENGLDFKFEVYEKRNRTFCICAAMCNNRGIGLQNGLPWPSIRGDYEHYISLTSKTHKKGQKCARIKGRLTWISTGEEERSDPNVLNIVVSRNNKDSINSDKHLHKVVDSLNQGLDFILQKPTDDIADTWIMGGQALYQEAVLHPLCIRIYLTIIKGDFKCDTYFPEFEKDFKEISDPLIDNSCKEENGIEYQFKVYERISKNKIV